MITWKDLRGSVARIGSVNRPQDVPEVAGNLAQYARPLVARNFALASFAYLLTGRMRAARASSSVPYSNNTYQQHCAPSSSTGLPGRLVSLLDARFAARTSRYRFRHYFGRTLGRCPAEKLAGILGNCPLRCDPGCSSPSRPLANVCRSVPGTPNE